MSRYQELQESELDEAQRRVWADVVAGPRHSVPPPAHVWLKSPGLADHATNSAPTSGSARISRRG